MSKKTIGLINAAVVGGCLGFLGLSLFDMEFWLVALILITSNTIYAYADMEK